MGRLERGRSNYDLVLTDADGRDLGLMLDKNAKNFAIVSKWVPVEGQEAASIAVEEWSWQNGPAGAGYSMETPESRQGGGSSHGEFVCLCFEGRAMPAGALTEITLPAATAAFTTGSFRDAFEWGSSGDLYLTTGTRYLLKMASGTGAPSEFKDFGSGKVSEHCALFRYEGGGVDRAYVSLGSTGYLQAWDGTTWTAGVSGTERLDLATVFWVIGDQVATGGLVDGAGNGGHRLIGVDSAAKGFYAVSGDPLDPANWTSLTEVGATPGQHPVAGIVASNRVVWFSKPSGIHSVDEVGYSPNVSKWVEVAYHPDNGKSVAYWNGMIFYAHRWGVVVVPVGGERQDTRISVNFADRRSNTSPIYGQPVAMAPSADGMWVAYYNGTDSYIGKVRVGEGGGRWSMAECVIRGQEVTWMRQTSPGGVPRLMIGTTDATGVMHLYWQSLPSTGDPEGDYLHDGEFAPAAEWELTLSEFDNGNPNEKTFRRYALEARNVGGGNTIEYQMAADGGDATVQGVATESPRWSGTPLASYVRATAAQIKLVCRNEGAAPIVIRSVSARYSPHPELTNVTAYPVIFGKGVPLNGSGTDHDDPAVKLARLELMQRADPISYVNQFGQPLEGIVEPGLSEVMELSSDGSGWVVHATLTMSVTRRLARFDVDLFDLAQFS